MAILPKDSSYEEFCDYVTAREPQPLSKVELLERWGRWQRLNSIQVSTGRGYRSMLPADERHLTNREREAKVLAEAQSQGRNIERV